MVVEEVPDPKVGPTDVKIRVQAAGMNFADVLRRRGDPYPESSPTPFIPGAEVAGIVVEVGSATEDPPLLGALVYAACRVGGYAQYVVVPAASVIPIPAGIMGAQSTALVVQGLTALFALRDAGPSRGGRNRSGRSRSRRRWLLCRPTGQTAWSRQGDRRRQHQEKTQSGSLSGC